MAGHHVLPASPARSFLRPLSQPLTAQVQTQAMSHAKFDLPHRPRDLLHRAFRGGLCVDEEAGLRSEGWQPDPGCIRGECRAWRAGRTTT